MPLITNPQNPGGKPIYVAYEDLPKYGISITSGGQGGNPGAKYNEKTGGFDYPSSQGNTKKDSNKNLDPFRIVSISDKPPAINTPYVASPPNPFKLTGVITNQQYQRSQTPTPYNPNYQNAPSEVQRLQVQRLQIPITKSQSLKTTRTDITIVNPQSQLAGIQNVSPQEYARQQELIGQQQIQTRQNAPAPAIRPPVIEQEKTFGFGITKKVEENAPKTGEDTPSARFANVGRITILSGASLIDFGAELVKNPIGASSLFVSSNIDAFRTTRSSLGELYKGSPGIATASLAKNVLIPLASIRGFSNIGKGALNAASVSIRTAKIVSETPKSIKSIANPAIIEGAKIDIISGFKNPEFVRLQNLRDISAQNQGSNINNQLQKPIAVVEAKPMLDVKGVVLAVQESQFEGLYAKSKYPIKPALGVSEKGLTYIVDLKDVKEISQNAFEKDTFKQFISISEEGKPVLLESRPLLGFDKKPRGIERRPFDFDIEKGLTSGSGGGGGKEAPFEGGRGGNQLQQFKYRYADGFDYENPIIDLGQPTISKSIIFNNSMSINPTTQSNLLKLANSNSLASANITASGLIQTNLQKQNLMGRLSEKTQSVSITTDATKLGKLTNLGNVSTQTQAQLSSQLQVLKQKQLLKQLQSQNLTQILTQKQFLRNNQTISKGNSKFDFLKQSKDIKQTGFIVSVRRRGKFESVSKQSLTKRAALSLGQTAVKAGAAATFKITPSNRPAEVTSFGNFSANEYFIPKSIRPTSSGEQVFTQKRETRIRTLGEKREITFKGIAANLKKNNKFGLFR